MSPWYRSSVLLATLVGVLVWSIGFSHGEERREIIVLRGSNGAAGRCLQWASAYMETNPRVTVIVSGGGTSAGFEALFEKKADVAMASREIFEKELQVAALMKVQPQKVTVCEETVAIVTHPTNPVSELTIEQLGGIYRGYISGWEEVGGPKQPIKKVTYTQTSGVSQELRHRAMEDDYFDSEAVIRDRFSTVLTEVARAIPFAIGYVPRLDAERGLEEQKVKIIAIKERRDASPLLPTVESGKTRSYPLRFPIYFYWNERTVTSEVKRFVDFCRSRCLIP